MPERSGEESYVPPNTMGGEALLGPKTAMGGGRGEVGLYQILFYF